ncbi:MAG: hypothetical protein SGCHY_004187 [Lobulomycetales sp.]
MRKGEQRMEVIRFQRKIYGLTGAAVILINLAILDALLNQLTFAGTLQVSFALILGNILSLIKSSITTLGREPRGEPSITELSSVHWLEEENPVIVPTASPEAIVPPVPVERAV